MLFTIITASDSHIPTIASLAKEIWNEHYPPIIGQAQVDYMLQKMYGEESLREQISTTLFFILLHQETPIGFANIDFNNAPNAYIPKFYLLKEFRGQGAAPFLAKHLFETLKNKNCSQVRLQVNRQNVMAINFYFKLGFKIEKCADFDIGNNLQMNDFVMIKAL